ncbi:hypothetical protein [Occallatibacter riparius]|uniref:Uncharacterized protein n=1 Tax=Occallatibacter riparius TaxID=1002689 RepID=A0A9J7BS74_9BACT|nr:hypothetical protein [Occallatibacter riparius]UWZ85431.1 hypothetical protein MOP44_05690 [Occallatibacter riparius]
MKSKIQAAWGLAACLVVQAWAAHAQVQLGELKASMSGTVAPGYSATYGNQTNSSHSWAIGGTADLSGSYHSPNFLSYDLGLYLNQSRANSNFQSISNASGFSGTANIFAGSEFPGAINYTKSYNSDGNYAIPGIADYVTHGDSDSFNINWTENIPRKPSVSAGYSLGSSRYTVYGTDDSGKSNFQAVNLHSSYLLAGFNMGAFFSDGTSHSKVPQFISGLPQSETNSNTGAYGFNVTHALPMHGSTSGTVSRSYWDTNFLGDKSTGSVDILDAVAQVHPATKVSVSGSATYSDNLSGQLFESVVQSGSSASLLNNSSSSALDLLGVVGYAPQENLQTNVSVERRSQAFLGKNYGMTSYAASASYAHSLLEGNFSASLSFLANSADQTGQDTLGFSTYGTYTTKIARWHLNGSFAYAQNVQTILVTYMNSHYNYSGTARRSWGKLNFGVGGSAGRTALTSQEGTASSSAGFNATVGYSSWATLTGSYSRASGQAIATGGGLVPIPIPPPVVPSSLVSLYGGNSYAFSFSSNPVKNLIISASYAKSTSNTSSNDITSENENEQFNTLLRYHYRKLNFTSGYARLVQGFSGSGLPPQMVASYYFGASRWFKFF